MGTYTPPVVADVSSYSKAHFRHEDGSLTDIPLAVMIQSVLSRWAFITYRTVLLNSKLTWRFIGSIGDNLSGCLDVQFDVGLNDGAHFETELVEAVQWHNLLHKMNEQESIFTKDKYGKLSLTKKWFQIYKEDLAHCNACGGFLDDCPDFIDDETGSVISDFVLFQWLWRFDHFESIRWWVWNEYLYPTILTWLKLAP